MEVANITGLSLEEVQRIAQRPSHLAEDPAPSSAEAPLPEKKAELP